MLHPWLQKAFPSGLITPEQKAFNKAMNSVREAVEWSYKELKQYFTSQNIKKNLKSGEAPVALLYICSALPLTFRACLCHTQNLSRFKFILTPFTRYTTIPGGDAEP